MGGSSGVAGCSGVRMRQAAGRREVAAGSWAPLEVSWAMRGSLIGGESHEHEAGSREVGGGSRVMGLIGGELGKLQEGAAQSRLQH